MSEELDPIIPDPITDYRHMKMRDEPGGPVRDVVFHKDEVPGLSPFDSAVRKMRSAAYCYNEHDYTAAYIMAKEAFEEVKAGLQDKPGVYVEAELVTPEITQQPEPTTTGKMLTSYKPEPRPMEPFQTEIKVRTIVKTETVSRDVPGWRGWIIRKLGG